MSRWLPVVLLVFLPSAATAGAWLQPEGSAYLRFSSQVLSTDTRFDENGNRVPYQIDEDVNGQYNDLGFNLYGEIGTAPDWNLIGIVNFKSVEQEQVTESSTSVGLGDLGFGLKRHLWKARGTVGSAGALLMFPSGYDDQVAPARGANSTSLNLNLQIGASVSRFWTNAEGFFEARSGKLRNQVGGSLGGGTTLHRLLAVRGEARGSMAVGALQESLVDQVNNAFDPMTADSSYLDFAGTISFTGLPGFALEAEVRTTALGENTLDATRWSLAVATSPSWVFGRSR